ncbi:2365_t:CDS:2 [Scutellospora calospora]|uniref:2365_t:CDS:1 n=1 Tax=Scutellospora calospora TaxID=85575 RepID=A0ACA9LAL0_9GLOM|nr:2365_t:CDS:2 [Scutellospora calospora]
MTALRHAFESKSTTGLFLKISKGAYPPIPSIYSKNLRKLTSSLLKISPNDRPSIEDILKLNFLNNHIERLIIDHPSQCEDDNALSNSRLIDNFFKEFACNPISRVSYDKISQVKKRQKKPAAITLSEGEKSHKSRISSNKSDKNLKEEPIRKSLVKSVNLITNHNDDYIEEGHIENNETGSNNLKNDNPKNDLSKLSSSNSVARNYNNFDNISIPSKSSSDDISVTHNSNFTSEKTINDAKKQPQSDNVKKINNSSVKYSKCNACNLNVKKPKPMAQIDKVHVLSKKPSSSTSPTKIISSLHKSASETTSKNSSTIIKQTTFIPNNDNSNEQESTLPLPTPPLSPSKKVEDNIMPPKITLASSSLLYSIANKDTKNKSWDTPFSLIEELKQDLEYLLGFDKFNQCYKLLIFYQNKKKITDENQDQSKQVMKEKIIETKLKLLLNGRGQHNYVPVLKELGKQILNSFPNKKII